MDDADKSRVDQLLRVALYLVAVALVLLGIALATVALLPTRVRAVGAWVRGCGTRTTWRPSPLRLAGLVTELPVKSERADARMTWLLRRMADPNRGGHCFITAWDTDTVDAFVLAFPEANKTLRVYLMGPNSSPMLNAAAKRAEAAGYVTAGSVGNQDARSFKQRTWCRTWRMTDAGRELLGLGGGA